MGERLHMLRRGKGWTQDDLAGKVGVSQSMVSIWERGETRKIDLKLLVILADTIGVSLDYLLGRVDQNTIGGSNV